MAASVDYEQIDVYEGNEPYIFISYSHKDTKVILPIIKELIDANYRVWFDKGIEGGTEWAKNIALHIKNCSAFLFFASGNSVLSENCLDEISYAKKYGKSAMLIYIEKNVILPDGVDMQTQRFQNMFKYRHSTNASFMSELFKCSILDPCKNTKASKTNTSSSKNTEELDNDRIADEKSDSYETAEKYCAEAWKYYEGKEVRKDYALAFELYLEAAKLGYYLAQYNVAVFYESGIGTRVNYKKAAKWYRESALKGYSSAQNSLGRCYETGKGVKKNYAEAVKWYKKSAEQDNEYALRNLAVCQYYGRGTERSYITAFQRLSELEKQNKCSGRGYYILGECYYYGRGTSVNYDEAMRCLRKASVDCGSKSLKLLIKCRKKKLKKDLPSKTKEERKQLKKECRRENFCDSMDSISLFAVILGVILLIAADALGVYGWFADTGISWVQYYLMLVCIPLAIVFLALFPLCVASDFDWDDIGEYLLGVLLIIIANTLLVTLIGLIGNLVMWIISII